MSCKRTAADDWHEFILVDVFGIQRDLFDESIVNGQRQCVAAWLKGDDRSMPTGGIGDGCNHLRMRPNSALIIDKNFQLFGQMAGGICLEMDGQRAAFKKTRKGIVLQLVDFKFDLQFHAFCK